jgi:hypothetical protein
MDPYKRAPDPVGVGGWLLLLCVKLAVLLPAIAVVTLAAALLGFIPRDCPTSEAVPLFVPEAVGLAALSALGMVAGIRLWLVKPGAVRLARAFFLLTIAVAVVTLGATGSMVHFEFGNDLLATQARGSLKAAVGATVWLLYLERSRRVKATYGAD